MSCYIYKYLFLPVLWAKALFGISRFRIRAFGWRSSLGAVKAIDSLRPTNAAVLLKLEQDNQMVEQSFDYQTKIVQLPN